MNAPAVYADVPYANRAHPQSHPDLLATGARLRGLVAPDPATARVLELGCGWGALAECAAREFDAEVSGSRSRASNSHGGNSALRLPVCPAACATRTTAT